MRFDDAFVIFQFLPAVIAFYYLAIASELAHPRLTGFGSKTAMIVLVGASAWLLSKSPVAALLLASVLITIVCAAVVERTAQSRPALSQAATVLAIAASAVMFAIVRARLDRFAFTFCGAAVLACHQIAFVVDVYRRKARTTSPAIAGLYLTQFPVLPTGPLVRYADVERHSPALDRALHLGAFTYGMRRVVIGLVKIVAIAGTLAGPADVIFKLPAPRLSTDAAWLAAICFSLQLYFQLSGYADIAIGLGRMLGFRYPENFHRPYLADSVREFWRRWHVTSIVWLRDYLAFPIAGRDAPTLRLLPNIVVGFLLLGFWYGGGWTVGLWAIYSAIFLALEAVGFGPRLARWGVWLRRIYVLLIVTVGWVVLRSESVSQAASMLDAMAGEPGTNRLTAMSYMTLSVWLALVVALVGAGPLIPWISRWRVSLDAATAAAVMMFTSVSLFLWRGGSVAVNVFSARRRNEK